MRLFIIALLFASTLHFLLRVFKSNENRLLQLDQNIFCKGELHFLLQTSPNLRNF
eukprot:UN21182